MANRISIRPEELLGIARGATPKEVSRARARLAKMLHPDLQDEQTTAIMQLINHAVEIMLTGEQGTYRFTNGDIQEVEKTHSNSSDRPGTCNHPRKPGYNQCFECSGIKLCPLCGTGYYRPPNRLCRNCRGAGRWNGYGGRDRR